DVRSAVAEFAQTERGTLVHPRLGEEPAGEHGAIMLRLARRECGLEPGSWQPLPEGAPTASAFYAHYLHQARPEADYEDLLSPWRTMLAQNLTTCPEIFENSRSDCHAWSAHPILGWLQRVAGIRSGGPGWSSVVVAPNPGSVTRFSAVVPHPAGDLKVSLEDGRLTVSSPVECRVEWAGPVAMV
ncbi:MAG: hypothetical protein MH204_07880, partial [Fimbriimonadaceae bacterium]|nr:hypothetical protein [Fimbriimonadaceae bacterium]